MKLLEKFHLVTLFICSFLLLSSTVLIWGCSTLKQKLTKKGRSSTILSHQERVHEQSLLKEFQERELMKYFGSYAILVLSDGFHFSDSGLVGNTATLHYRTQSLAIENLKDSLSLELIKGNSTKSEEQLTLEESEQSEERESSSFSRWWVLLLIPVFWFKAKRVF